MERGNLSRRGFLQRSLGTLAAAGLRFYQVSGLQRLVRASGLLRLVPGPLASWEPLLPVIPPAAARAPLPEVTPAEGAKRATVGLLTGCIQQVAFGPHNRATARVLARNGVEVIAPRTQTCCGALHAHAGEHATALELAKSTIIAHANRMRWYTIGVSNRRYPERKTHAVTISTIGYCREIAAPVNDMMNTTTPAARPAARCVQKRAVRNVMVRVPNGYSSAH